MLEPPACSRPARDTPGANAVATRSSVPVAPLGTENDASPAPSQSQGRPGGSETIDPRPSRTDPCVVFVRVFVLSSTVEVHRSLRRPLRSRRRDTTTRDTSTRTSRARRTRVGLCARSANRAETLVAPPRARRWSRRPSAVPLGSTGSESSSSTRQSRRRECPAVCAPRKMRARRFPDRSPPTRPRRRGERRRPRVATSRNRRAFDSRSVRARVRGDARRARSRARVRGGGRGERGGGDARQSVERRELRRRVRRGIRRDVRRVARTRVLERPRGPGGEQDVPRLRGARRDAAARLSRGVLPGTRAERSQKQI